jgi:hypothetical protein
MVHGRRLYLIRSQQIWSETIFLGGFFSESEEYCCFLLYDAQAPFMLYEYDGIILSCTNYSLFLLCRVLISD